ncbi:MAG TPA: hypothetical protein VGG74_04485 [Kofleriaceae bacterium]|jgi:hypothetical protein
MASPPKEKVALDAVTEEVSDEREVYLPRGRTLSVDGDLVEIKSSSGMVELRVRLTDQGLVLQMESARLQLKATESLEIESKRVAIKATEELALTGSEVNIEGEADVNVDAKGEVRVVGKMIHLN